MQAKTLATATMKIAMEQRKEKRVYFLPGQKHDPPEDVWNTNSPSYFL